MSGVTAQRYLRLVGAAAPRSLESTVSIRNSAYHALPRNFQRRNLSSKSQSTVTYFGHRWTAVKSRKINTRSMTSAAETDSQAAAVANTSGVTIESLQSTLTEKVGAETVIVQDISGGCGQSFEAVIVSAQFEKKNTLARHRLVNGALKQEIAAIHAWTPRCFTPEEWEKRGKA